MINTSTCLYCGTEFVKRSRVKLYCSDGCRSKNNHQLNKEKVPKNENEDSLQPRRILAMSEFLSKLQATGKLYNE